MGLAAILASAIATADSITSDLQPSVLHEAWIANDQFNVPVFAAGISRKAIVELKQELMRNDQGEQIQAEHVVTIIRPIAANGASGRQEPIDPRDRFTLPDGSIAGAIIKVTGFMNRLTSAPYFCQVYLGKAGTQ